MTVKKTIIYGIIALWVFMASFFFRREILPRIYEPPITGYSGVFSYAQANPEYMMEVFRIRSGEPDLYIGKIQTVLQLQRDGSCEISSQVEMDYDKVLPGIGPMDADFRTTLLPDNSLKSMSFYCHSALANCRGNSRISGDELVLSMIINGQNVEKIIPRRQIVMSDITGIGALPDLRVGQILHLRSLDLMSPQPHLSTVEATVTRRTAIVIRGRQYDVFEVDMQGQLPMKAYVSKNGDILQYNILGLFTMIRRPLPGEPDIHPPPPPDEAAPPRPDKTSRPAATVPARSTQSAGA